MFGMAYGRDKSKLEEKPSQSSPAMYTMQDQEMTLLPERRRVGAPREDIQSQLQSDGIDSRETCRSSGNMDWSRTSFKIKKSKPGKIRHLSNQELFGIGISFLLSLLMAIFIAFSLLNLSPIVLRHLTNFIFDVNEVGLFAKKTLFPTTLEGSPSIIEIPKNISEAIFNAHCYKQAPCLFSVNAIQFSTENYYNFSSLLIDNIQSDGNSTENQFSIQNGLNGKIDDFIVSVNVNATAKFGSIPVAIPLLDSIFTNSTLLRIAKPTQYVKSSQFKVGKGFASLLLEGKRKWVVFKQDKFPKKGLNTALRLEDFKQNQFDDDSFYILIQNTEEYVYIPEGWLYGFEVLDDKISVSVEYEVKQVDSSSYLPFYLQANNKLFLGDVLGAIKLFKLGLALNRNILLLEGLGDALTANSQFLAGEEFYREVISINPRSVSAYRKLINLLVSHSRQDASESISELLTLASEAGVRDEVIAAIQY